MSPRSEAVRIKDILKAATSVQNRLSGFSEQDFFADESAVKAALYDVIVIGEAISTLHGKKDEAGNAVTDDAAIVAENPNIPWKAWIGMRNMVTHQYFIASPHPLWTDFEEGALLALADVCKRWLQDNEQT